MNISCISAENSVVYELIKLNTQSLYQFILICDIYPIDDQWKTWNNEIVAYIKTSNLYLNLEQIYKHCIRITQSGSKLLFEGIIAIE